ncbi:MAG: serine/threonine-protein kinase [Nannocystaceae bacterium]
MERRREGSQGRRAGPLDETLTSSPGVLLAASPVATRPGVGDGAAARPRSTTGGDGAAAEGLASPTSARPSPPSRASAGLDETVARPRGESSRSAPGSDVTVARPGSGVDARAVAIAADGAGSIAPGSQIGRFIVLRPLGAGAMGVVFEAIDPELDRKVAIKLLQADARGEADSTRSADARTRLVREAQALARLSHPNVVGIFDVGVHEAQVWLAMELVVGRTLRRWIEASAPAWPEVLEVMLAAGRGLAAAHAAGLVHRDIKPDNIMLGDDGRVRVMDFGLARWGARDEGPGSAAIDAGAAPARTVAGALLGTPAYMAPEQFRGEIAGPQADLFAFCVMLWEGLHGERPFAGETLEELRESVEGGRLRGRPRRARAPRWIDAALTRGMAADPARRWPTMEALLEALGRGRARARARRWAAVAGALGLSGLALAAQASHAEAAQVAACEAAGASVDAIWSDAAEARLRAGLLASGASYAASTADKVMPHFAAQAAALREARIEACLDTRVRGLWDEALLDRAEWCLDEREMALDALVTELDGGQERGARGGGGRSEPRLGLVVSSATSPRGPPEPAGGPRRGPGAAASALAGGRAAGRRQVQGVARARRGRGAPGGGARVAAAGGRDPPPPRQLAHQRRSLRRRRARARARVLHRGRGPRPRGGRVRGGEALVYLVGARRARHEEGVRWYKLADVALTLLGDEGEGCGAARRSTTWRSSAPSRPEYEEARALYERALAIEEAALGPRHLGIANLLNDLGILRFRMEAYDEAGALHERALAIREAALGPDHPDVAASLSNLANVRIEQGAGDKARALLERALGLLEAALGPDHPRVAEPLGTLASLTLAAGDLPRARSITARVMAIDEAALGPDHPDVALSLDLLATIARDTGELKEAKALLERARTIREAALGPDHPETVATLRALAAVEEALSGDAAAEAPHPR